jgi:hypothetical protein
MDMIDFIYKYGVVTSNIIGSGSPVQDLGTGFYFAKDARLLHEVAKFHPDECIIFLCKILIGSRQVGPVGDAYSKVIHDTFTTRDEAVILKIENLHCYPEYAISYKVEAEDKPLMHDHPPPYSPPDVSNTPPAYPTSTPLRYPYPDYLAHIPSIQPSAPPVAPPTAPERPTLIPPRRFEASDSDSDMYQSGEYRLYPSLPSNDQTVAPKVRGKKHGSSGSKDQCSVQ